MQPLLTQACTAFICIANNCLETRKSNKIVGTRGLLANAATVMEKLNTMLANERKTKLKPTHSESYQSLCDQNFSQSKYILGEYLPGELRKAKSQHFLEATVFKRHKRSVSTTKKKPNKSLKCQGRKMCIQSTELTFKTESAELLP